LTHYEFFLKGHLSQNLFKSNKLNYDGFFYMNYQKEDVSCFFMLADI